MKILILGSDGFIGKRVKDTLAKEHDVYGTTRSPAAPHKSYTVDLLQKDAIIKVLDQLRPEAIINCAGVVENNDQAKINPILTSNLLTSIAELGLDVRQIIISGSAAEYGVVKPAHLPVNENTPLNATSIYGLSKVEETSLALQFGQAHGLPVVVARIFNPIGVGMHPKFLIPSLIRQVGEIKAGHRQNIEVSRLDTIRDYINASDVVSAIKALVQSKPREVIYNIGSGHSTSNSELIDLVLNDSKLASRPDIIETFPEPEPLFAAQADITRITSEIGWKPEYMIEATIKEIINASQE